MPVFSPDDLMAGGGPAGGRVMLYDDDHFYMGSVLAEVLAARGCAVEFVTPAPVVAEWTKNTLEQGRIQRRLMEIGVALHCGKAPESIGPGEVVLGCTWTGRQTALAADAVVMVTSRVPQDALYHDLRARDWQGAGILTVQVIGDAAAPGPIAWATYAGRRWAEALDAPDSGDALAFRREIAALAP
jgi:dimethylamine/trimethylamine dehydrogenase